MAEQMECEREAGARDLAELHDASHNRMMEVGLARNV